MENSSASESGEDDRGAHPIAIPGGIRGFDSLLAELPRPDEIAEVGDGVDESPWAANEDMMEGYFAISNSLGSLLHGDHVMPENATFPTFAVWTTETLRAEVDRRSGQTRQPYAFVRPVRRVYKQAARMVLRDDDIIARNIARGEAAIYQEIGPAIYYLMETIVQALAPHAPAGVPSDGEWQKAWGDYGTKLTGVFKGLSRQRRFPDEFESVGPPCVTTLQRAVQPYFEVFSKGLSRWNLDERGRKERAELILLGNVRFEAYAQQRLQPVLERNLAYVPDALRGMIAGRLTGHSTLRSDLLRRVYRRCEPAINVFDEAFKIAATRHVYVAVIGDEQLSLGRDLPVPPPANPVLRCRQPRHDQERYVQGGFFPYALQSLKTSATWAAWQQYDRSSGEGSRTAVDSWLRYEERLNYLANLLRSRQQLTALYNMPRSIRRLSRSRPPQSVAGDGGLRHAGDYPPKAWLGGVR
jgi:hypothetical protein